MFSPCSSPALDMSCQVQWTGITRKCLVAKSLHFRHTNNFGFTPVSTWPSSHFKMSTTVDISNNSDFSTPLHFKFTLLNTLRAEYLCMMEPGRPAVSAFILCSINLCHKGFTKITSYEFLISISLRTLSVDATLMPSLVNTTVRPTSGLSYSKWLWSPDTFIKKIIKHMIPSSAVIQEHSLKLHFYLNKVALSPAGLKALFTLTVWCPFLSIRDS